MQTSNDMISQKKEKKFDTFRPVRAAYVDKGNLSAFEEEGGSWKLKPRSWKLGGYRWKIHVGVEKRSRRAAEVEKKRRGRDAAGASISQNEALKRTTTRAENHEENEGSCNGKENLITQESLQSWHRMPFFMTFQNLLD